MHDAAFVYLKTYSPPPILIIAENRQIIDLGTRDWILLVSILLNDKRSKIKIWIKKKKFIINTFEFPPLPSPQKKKIKL